MRRAALALAAVLVLAAPAAADEMDGRLAGQVERTSQCGAGDWGGPCGWVNVEAYGPVFFRVHSPGSWGPLTVHDRDTGEVEQNLVDVPIPDYAAQGPWRSTEDPWRADLAAVFIDHTGPETRVCEVWNLEWPWWLGPTARHGGCMPYEPGESARAFPWPMGSQASGLRYVDGVVTVAEWRAWLDHGAVPDHELQVAVPLACRTFREPANRSDGGNWAEPGNSDCIEYGTLYGLPAGYDPPDCRTRQVDGCIWSRFVLLAIAIAREHGIRVSDQTGYSVIARVENPGRLYASESVDGFETGGEGEPAAHPYGFYWDDRLMRQFPWRALTVRSDGAR